jgi:hypothetical protein
MSQSASFNKPRCLKSGYKVVQIWPGLFVCKQVTVCPGHVWTTLYMKFYTLFSVYAECTRYRSLLSHCGISRKVAGSNQEAETSRDKVQRQNKKIKTNPDVVLDIFYRLKPTGFTMALRSILPLTAMSRVKVAGTWGKQPCHPHVPIVWESWELEIPGALGNGFTFTSVFTRALFLLLTIISSTKHHGQ